jgi:hypothetical protein
MRGERTSAPRCQDARKLQAQEAQSLPYCNAALQQKADLIDDAGALAHQALPDTVQRLQVELVDRLGRHELHGWALHRLGDRFCVAVVVLLPPSNTGAPILPA